jgi:hypothetical protein
MKLPFLNTMREAAQRLMGKGASAAPCSRRWSKCVHQAKGMARRGRCHPRFRATGDARH